MLALLLETIGLCRDMLLETMLGAWWCDCTSSTLEAGSTGNVSTVTIWATGAGARGGGGGEGAGAGGADGVG